LILCDILTVVTLTFHVMYPAGLFHIIPVYSNTVGVLDTLV